MTPRHPARWDGERMNTTEATSVARGRQQPPSSSGAPDRLRRPRAAPPPHRLDRPQGRLGIGGEVGERRRLVPWTMADRAPADPAVDRVVGFALLAAVLEAAIGYGETKDRRRRPPRVSPTSSSPGRRSRWPGWRLLSRAADRGLHRHLMESPGGASSSGSSGSSSSIAGYHVYKGWTKKFLQDLREHPGGWAVHAGRIGYIAKGIALVIVGFFFLVAAWRATPSRRRASTGAEDAQGPAVRAVPADPRRGGDRGVRRTPSPELRYARV